MKILKVSGKTYSQFERSACNQRSILGRPLFLFFLLLGAIIKTIEWIVVGQQNFVRVFRGFQVTKILEFQWKRNLGTPLTLGGQKRKHLEDVVVGVSNLVPILSMGGREDVSRAQTREGGPSSTLAEILHKFLFFSRYRY